jgi:uncharacterized surface protein with fasciclin (FAS1) repeats
MLFRSLLGLAAGAALVSSQAITDVLTGAPELSTLTSIVTRYPELVSALAGASNITILAPSNDAFSKLLASPAGARLAQNDSALIQAVLSYHVLQGNFPASAITDRPAFVPTLLDNPRYTNVTGGQRVEVVKKEDKVYVYSGGRANSTVTKAVSSNPSIRYHRDPRLTTLTRTLPSVAAWFTSLTPC